MMILLTPSRPSTPGSDHGIEFDDMNRFGKVRDGRDKELRDPDDVFIHAEERRKELARQRKRQPKGKKRAG